MIGAYNGLIFSKHKRAAEHMYSHHGHPEASPFIFPDSSKYFIVISKIYIKFIQNFK